MVAPLLFCYGCVMDASNDYLDKRIEMVNKQLIDAQDELARLHGQFDGWSPCVEKRLDRLERLLDNLTLALMSRELKQGSQSRTAATDSEK
jgi:hypothetical protein